jgi:hypothetical protein
MRSLAGFLVCDVRFVFAVIAVDGGVRDGDFGTRITVVDVLSMRLGVVYAGAVVNAGHGNALDRTLVGMLDPTDLFRVCSEVVGNVRARGV